MFLMIEAAKDGNKASVIGVAYTGNQMRLSGWKLPVVIDLMGMDIDPNVPLLADHENSIMSRIGEARARVENNELVMDGEISGEDVRVGQIIERVKAGQQWQLSVGADVIAIKSVKENETVFVNGREFAGPIVVATKSKLREISVVALGADADTVMKLAAKMQYTEPEKEKEMPKEIEKDVEPIKAVAQVVPEPVKSNDRDIVAEMRAESKRISAITAACAKHPEISAKAIAEGWTLDAAKAAMFDAVAARGGSEINASYLNFGESDANGADVLEAAVMMASGGLRAKKLEEVYEEKTLDAADKMRSMGLNKLIEACARMDGVSINSLGSDTDIAAAGFSTISLPTILNNVAKKSLMDEYMAVPSIAAMLSERLNANTFHQFTGIRLGGMGVMKDVAEGGSIKHGTMSEETFTYQVGTKGMLIGITRQMLKNDDLGAFTRTARNAGRSAYNARELAFWQLVLANTGSFFSSGHGNLVSVDLDSSGLATAETALLLQTGIDGTPINVSDSWLVVPPQLGAAARGLYKSTNLVGGSTAAPSANVFEGVYEPLVTPYLANSAVHSNASATGWYLMSKSVKPFGIAYLDGNEAPIVEEVPTDPAYLGRLWRAYFDFGVCQIDYRGAVMSEGAGS